MSTRVHQNSASATAPCPLSAPPSPDPLLAACLDGGARLVVGLAPDHRTPAGRAALAAALPATLLFGYGFGGLDALLALLRTWYII